MMTDLAVLGDDYATDIERASDPAGYVIQACERAKVWLAQVLEHGDIEQIVELKSQAEAIRVYTMSKQLGHDAQLSAAEIVRRAERGIGVAIRRGQAAGTITTRADGPAIRDDLVRDMDKVSPKTYFASNPEMTDTYAMTDGVSDERFEDAVAEAKGEGNLSRANVARKARPNEAPASSPSDAVPEPGDRSGEASIRRRAIVREMAETGHTSRQIGARIGKRYDTVRQMAREMGVAITADDAMGKGHRRIDSNRIIRETVGSLDAMVTGIDLIDWDAVDASETADWVNSLTDSIRVLNRLNKRLKEMTQ